MTGVSLVYAVFANEASARDVARIAVSERLAACVNIMASCTSVYEWEGGLEENSETPALFKTNADMVAALIARIAALHSYDMPAIISWAADAAHLPFAQWLTAQTHK